MLAAGDGEVAAQVGVVGAERQGALLGVMRTLAVTLGADGIAVACDMAAAMTGQVLCADGGLIMR